MDGYCMHAALFSEDAGAIIEVLGLRDRVAEGAAFLAARVPPDSPRPWIAVHVRHGDYREIGRILVPDFYSRGASAMNISAGTFVVFSDDVHEAALEPVTAALRASAPLAGIVRFSAASDFDEFAAMAACDAFIVPNSTFSWFAAFIAWVLRGRGTHVPVVMPDIEHGKIPGRTIAEWTSIHAEYQT